MMDTPKIAEMQLPGKLENRQILDLCTIGDSGSHVAFLYDKNQVVIFELASRTAVFKASYADATDLISNIHFVASTPPSRTLVDDEVNVPSESMLGGYLLLVETRLQTVKKEVSKSKAPDQQNASISRTKLLRKLHLVEIQQSMVTSKKGNEVKDKLEQIDALSFGEETAKLVDFVRIPPSSMTNGRPNYFAFMVNKERIKSSGHMKLFSVKIKWARQDTEKHESSSELDFGGTNKKQTDEMEEEKDAKEESKQVGGKKSLVPDLKLKFEFISEVMPKISNFSGEKQKPSFIKVVSVSDNTSEDGQTTFYVYTGVGIQSVVFKRNWEEVSPPFQDEDSQSNQNISKISDQNEAMGKLNTGEQIANLEAEDMIRKIDEEVKQEGQNDAVQFDRQVKEKLSEIEGDEEGNKADSSLGGINNDPAVQMVYGAKRKAYIESNNPGGKRGKEKEISANAGQTQPMYKTKKSSSRAASPRKPNQTNPADAAQQSQSKLKQQKEKTQKEQSAAPVQVPQSKKAQQDLIIENYAELNKKFTELHMKMNSLQQQVKAQKDLQIQVEQTVTKAVKQALPEIVKKQVEDTVTPLIEKQVDLLDQRVKNTMLPKIDMALQRIASQSQQANNNNSPPVPGAQQQIQQQPPIANQQQPANLSNEAIRKVIQAEFRTAMVNAIMPELEKELKTMLNKVKDPITSVNKVLYEKLVNEEQRSDYMVQTFEQKLQMVQQQHNQQQHQQQLLQQSQYLQPSQSFSVHHAAGGATYTPQPSTFILAQAPQPQPSHYQFVHHPEQQQQQQTQQQTAPNLASQESFQTTTLQTPLNTPVPQPLQPGSPTHAQPQQLVQVQSQPQFTFVPSQQQQQSQQQYQAAPVSFQNPSAVFYPTTTSQQPQQAVQQQQQVPRINVSAPTFQSQQQLHSPTSLQQHTQSLPAQSNQILSQAPQQQMQVMQQQTVQPQVQQVQQTQQVQQLQQQKMQMVNAQPFVQTNTNQVMQQQPQIQPQQQQQIQEQAPQFQVQPQSSFDQSNPTTSQPALSIETGIPAPFVNSQTIFEPNSLKTIESAGTQESETKKVSGQDGVQPIDQQEAVNQITTNSPVPAEKEDDKANQKPIEEEKQE